MWGTFWQFLPVHVFVVEWVDTVANTAIHVIRVLETAWVALKRESNLDSLRHIVLVLDAETFNLLQGEVGWVRFIEAESVLVLNDQELRVHEHSSSRVSNSDHYRASFIGKHGLDHTSSDVSRELHTNDSVAMLVIWILRDPDGVRVGLIVVNREPWTLVVLDLEAFLDRSRKRINIGVNRLLLC